MAEDGDGDRYAGLIGTTLLVATPDDPEEPGTWTLVEREVLSVLLEEDDAGLLSPVFTTTDALARWRPEGGCYVEREAAWLFGVSTADPDGRVVVDPGSPSSIVLSPADVAALAEGRSPAAPAGAAVLLATPSAPLAEGVADAVRGALAAHEAVRSARLFLVDDAGAGPQPLVMVELEAGLDAASTEVLQDGLATDVASRTDEAAGLRFAWVTDEWRATYGSGGLALYER